MGETLTHPAPCGTPAAYDRHRRRGERPDAECRKARNWRDARVRRERLEAAAAEGHKDAIEQARKRRAVRWVQLPGGPMPLGALAGTVTPHPFIPDGHTGTSCLACFGWCSDPAHLGRPALAGAEVTP